MIKAFLVGMARTLDIGGVVHRRHPRRRYYPYRGNGWAADREALESDRKAIENDFELKL